MTYGSENLRRLLCTILISVIVIALCLSLLSLSALESDALLSATEDPSTPTSTCTGLGDTPTSTLDPTHTSSPTMQTSVTSTSIQETPTTTPTITVTPTPTATSTAAASFPPFAVLINEVAWAGTIASALDEWIELFNPGSEAIDLTGWKLVDGGDINFNLSRTIAPHSLFLLERTDDTTISDKNADLIYTGGLNNGGETLRLLDPSGAIIDSANASGGAWPAGDVTSRASMERRGGSDHPSNWATWNGYNYAGHDAGGNPIAGTPRQANSLFYPTPITTKTITPTAIQETLTPTPTRTATPTPTSTTTPAAIASFPPFAVLINEVAWAGTRASALDEWIELFNPGMEVIDLADWRLEDGGDISIILNGTIAPRSLFLLERTDDTTIYDMSADLIYTGGLNNGGESLRLLDPSGAIIDSANAAGGAWPAGDAPSYASMERRGGSDHPSNWATWNGFNNAGHDAGGNPIAGTPRQTNSLLYPTPTPTSIPGQVVINEVLIRPHYDWNGSGEADIGDEFIELYNLGPSAVVLSGWILDDVAGGGSRPYTLPHWILQPGKRAVFFRSQTHISLNDAGDTVRLLSPDGRLIDRIEYIKVRAYNLSYGRLPDGSSHLAYGLWPTPRCANVLFVEYVEVTPTPAEETSSMSRWDLCPLDTQPWPLLANCSRHPAMLRWMFSMGLHVCR